MSTFRSYAIRCTCRHAFKTELAVAVNVARMPELRAAIVDGSFHRVRCPSCGRTFTAEKKFVYIDFSRGLVVQVNPPGQSPKWRQASAELDSALHTLDMHGVFDRNVKRRVTFGIGELREKLIAEDAGLDDRVVELTKVMAIHEHPVLLKRPRLRLFLDKVYGDRLTFFAGYDHNPQAFQAEVPRFAVDRLSSDNTAPDWAASHRQSIFTLKDDSWISVRRWSPSNVASGSLHDYANQLRAGQDINLDDNNFKVMVANLPSGSQLPTAAKIDLRDIEKYAKAKNRPDIQKQLFEVRFGVQLDDEWGADKQTGDIDTLWDLLKDLPETNVVGNTSLHEIILKPGEGGGMYNPGSDDIEVTDAGDSYGFQNTMRHEVGHAVQARLDSSQGNLVTNWLIQRFGWQTFAGNTAGATAWVNLMDGWDGLTGSDRQRLSDTLVQALGGGSSWDPPQPPSPPPGSSWWKAGSGPRSAVEGTHSKWYDSNASWYRKNGRAYFLNYWYREFMSIPEAQLDFIDTKMPWDYAAMSPGEFFAELYALYYRLDAPNRLNIEQNDRNWFDTNVGVPQAGAPAPPTV